MKIFNYERGSDIMEERIFHRVIMGFRYGQRSQRINKNKINICQKALNKYNGEKKPQRRRQGRPGGRGQGVILSSKQLSLDQVECHKNKTYANSKPQILARPLLQSECHQFKENTGCFVLSVLFKSIERNVILSNSFLPFPFPCFREK